MKPTVRAINLNSYAKKVQVDNRLPLRYYYRTADSLVRQARVYREENNLIDLYIILLRFSSLMCETIPLHRDYHLLLPKEKLAFKKELLTVLNELEALKPVVQQKLEEVNRGYISELGGKNLDSSSFSIDGSSTKNSTSSISYAEQISAKTSSQTFLKYSNGINQANSPDYLHMGKQLPKMSFSLPNPKEETLSRHSILGPNKIQAQWSGAIAGPRVQYPSNFDIQRTEIPSISHAVNSHAPIMNEIEGISRDMESVLSLFNEPTLTKQPSPPPVLAEVHELPVLDPSKVADPRPGLPKMSSTHQHLHVPVQMMEAFLKIAESNTKKNLETCGVLAGSLKNSKFYVSTLIIPKQESTSDACQTTNEEEIFEAQDSRSLFPLGWIHTHPTQTCFMSSVDLHTHYSYQRELLKCRTAIVFLRFSGAHEGYHFLHVNRGGPQVMLPEAIAIVMAPTDTSRTHGIFHLTDPGGISVIRNCQQRGFHPHEELEDGGAIYEHCSHVYMNPRLDFEVLDLR